MPEKPTPTTPKPAPKPQVVRPHVPLGIRIKRFLVRVYALILLLVVAWAFYMAVAYLVRSVFMGNKIPPEYVNWQGRLEAHTLGAVQEEAGNRPPLAHYHTVGREFPADRNNGCIASACHGSLPHSRSKALRSFANFHATFLACQNCHEPSANRPMAAAWVSTATGKVQGSPALLQLMGHLEMDKAKLKTDPAAVHPVIVALLRDTLATIGEDPLLQYLLVRIDTAEPGSPVWRHAVDQLTTELPLHLRGEYGARIVPLPLADDYRAVNKELRNAARQYASAVTSPTEKAEVDRKSHGSLAKKPALCLDCHGDQSSLLDFKALGYSPVHAAMLSNSPVARQMQRIEQGQPFYLPRVLEGGNEK